MLLICSILQELAFSEEERTRNKKVGLPVCQSAIYLELEGNDSLLFGIFAPVVIDIGFMSHGRFNNPLLRHFGDKQKHL